MQPEPPQRFKYLQYGIDGISAKVLSENLKQLEADGLIKRTVYDEMPIRIEYSLTDLGEQMRPIIQTMADWGQVYIAQRTWVNTNSFATDLTVYYQR